MCGINLIIDKNNKLGSDPIKKMTAATHHRGPEHNAFLEISASQRIFLGQNRLKINDKSDAANQPFVSPCNQYFLIYNGEIYNFQDLKNDLLDQGKLFRTHSDTEVLFHLLIEKGISSLSMLEGMFSIIFYDKEKEEFIIARDRNGIKPLFYYDDPSFLIASSETRGILASGLVAKKLNEHQIYHYLNFRFAKAPETFYKEIYSVEPGHFLSLDKNSIKSASFIINNQKEEQIPVEDHKIVEQTEELLTDAISKQLYADVHAGIFLSGGVDSTLILALIQKAGLQMIPSFSIVHKKEEKSFGTEDYKFAKKAATQYGSYQYEIEVDIEDLNHFDEFIKDLDQPIGDSAAFLTYKLSFEAKKNVGVVLSGAGADEVFAGYHRHHAFKWYLEHYKLVQSISPVLKFLIPLLPSGFNNPFRKKAQLIKKFIDKVSADPGDTFLKFSTLSIPHDQLSEIKHHFKEPQQIESNLKSALKFDKSHYLISDVLALTDQMSMKYGLEVRLPYLDHNLNQYLNSLPATQIFSGERKWILNRILSQNGGKEFVKRRKEGMGLPFGNWIRKAPSNQAISYIKSKSCILFKYIPEETIIKLLNDHLKGKADNTLEIWSIVVLEAWLQKEFL
ncbi:MAG: asparagine synthase (glutamine-hydrolyzing) [Bacteroidota bacterium]|nr:asparagine synthase (glutamine-hydrolyzing) [Bacteroidota bacterium]